MEAKELKDRNPITRWEIALKDRTLFNPNNKAVICGIIDEDLVYNHRETGTRIVYYRTRVSVVEINGRENKIPIYISSKMLTEDCVKGKWIELSGIIKTHRGDAKDGHRYLNMGIYVTRYNIYENLEESQEKEYINIVYLKGTLKADAYSIYQNKVDMQLIVRDKKRRRAACIPSIVIGLNVENAQYLKKNDVISFFGKFQSKKIPGKGCKPERTAYEIATFKYYEY